MPEITCRINRHTHTQTPFLWSLSM